MVLFKLNNLRLALGMILKFCTSVAKGLKLKVRKFLRLIFMFVEVTWEKLVVEKGRGAFCLPFPVIRDQKELCSRERETALISLLTQDR